MGISIHAPSASIIASVAPLRMQVQSDLESFVVKLPYLPLDEVDSRICAARLNSLELSGLNEDDETRVMGLEHVPESPRRLVNEIRQCTRAIAIDLIVQRQDTVDHPGGPSLHSELVSKDV